MNFLNDWTKTCTPVSQNLLYNMSINKENKKKITLAFGNNCKEKHVQKWNKPKLNFLISWIITAWEEFSGSWHCSVTEPENKFCYGSCSPAFRHHSTTRFPSRTELASFLHLLGSCLLLRVHCRCCLCWVPCAVQGLWEFSCPSQQHLLQLVLFYPREN